MSRFRIPEREFDILEAKSRRKKIKRDKIINKVLDRYFKNPNFKKYQNPSKKYFGVYHVKLSEENKEHLKRYFVPDSKILTKAIEIYYIRKKQKELKFIEDGKYKRITIRLPDELHFKISDYWEKRTEFLIKSLQYFFKDPDFTVPKRKYTKRDNMVRALVPEDIYINMQRSIAPLNNIVIKSIEMFFYPELYMPTPKELTPKKSFLS